MSSFQTRPVRKKQILMRFFAGVFLLFLVSSNALALPPEKSRGNKDRTVEEMHAEILRKNTTKQTVKDLQSVVQKRKDAQAGYATAVFAEYLFFQGADPKGAVQQLRTRLLPSDATAAEKANKGFPSAARCSEKEPYCLLAAARIQAAQKNISEGLKLYDKVGAKHQGILQAFAGVGVGDIKFDAMDYEAAMKYYQIASSALRLARKSGDPSGTEVKLPEHANALEELLRGKIAKTKRRIEAEQYGPEYLAFCDAGTLENTQKYPEAYLAYRDICRDYPGTVYAEASTFYAIRCLYELGKPIAAKSVSDELEKFKKGLPEREKKLKQERSKLVPFVYAERLHDFRENKAYQARIAGIPLAKKALAESLAELQRFLDSNPTGLHRGEALLMFGNHYLERFGDIPKAQEYFERTKKWVLEIEKSRTALTEWQVPEKAKKVTAPPPKMYTVTENTHLPNYMRSECKPGQLFNHNTASWYLDDLIMNASILNAFCYYMKKDKEAALEECKIILERNEYAAMCHKEDASNIYLAFTSSISMDLFHFPEEEINMFSGIPRLILCLSDYYTFGEDFKYALKLRKDLLDGLYGKFNREQYAVVLFRYAFSAICRIKDGKEKEGIEILKRFYNGEFKGTFASSEAIAAYASYCFQNVGVKDVLIARIECIERAIAALKKGKNRKLKDKLEFMYAHQHHTLYIWHHDIKGYHKGKKLFQEIISKNKNSYWWNQAKIELSELEYRKEKNDRLEKERLENEKKNKTKDSNSKDDNKKKTGDKQTSDNKKENPDKKETKDKKESKTKKGKS